MTVHVHANVISKLRWVSFHIMRDVQRPEILNLSFIPARGFLNNRHRVDLCTMHYPRYLFLEFGYIAQCSSRDCSKSILVTATVVAEALNVSKT